MLYYYCSNLTININGTKISLIELKDILTSGKKFNECDFCLIQNNSTLNHDNIEVIINTLTKHPKLLFISNHIEWNKGWVIFRLKPDKYETYQIYKDTNNVKNKKLNFLLIRPVNGLANRIRFLVSTIGLGNLIGYRNLIFWSNSNGFDSATFETLFQNLTNTNHNISIINDYQYDILYINSCKLDDHIIGLNGINTTLNHTIKTNFDLLDLVKNNNIISITGSNYLPFVFTQYPNLIEIGNKIDQLSTSKIYKLIQPSNIIKHEIDNTLRKFHTHNTYGFHIRRGENINFLKSKLIDFIKIAGSILYNEPNALIFLSTNSKLVLNQISQYVPKDKILTHDKIFDNVIDLNFTYLDHERPEGSSISSAIDLFLLSKTKKVFGTDQSSFSMVSTKLSNIPLDLVSKYDNSKIYNHFKNGWSIVTCCKNRNQMLLRNIVSWLKIPEIDEYVIIDWSSETNIENYLKSNGVTDSRIIFYRIDNQNKWILTWGYNAGLLFANYDKLIKLDCDIYLSPDFIKQNNFFNNSDNNVFYTGNWETSHQLYLNGQMIIKKIDFLRVNGYNENIITYGYDDCDLYKRLNNIGLKRTPIIEIIDDTYLINHTDHTNYDRIKYQSINSLNNKMVIEQNDLQVLIINNKILSEKYNWSDTQSRNIYYLTNNNTFVIIS